MHQTSKTSKLQHYVNHIALVVDRSSSMQGQPVVEVFDRELQNLKQRSIDLNQETRISVYLFDNTVECLAFDMDVMRFSSLRGLWQVHGYTAMIDGTLQAIRDAKRLPEIHGDHAFLVYVITDGEENRSQGTTHELRVMLEGLPENWTVACMVPNAKGKFEAKKFGFADDAISVWDTSASDGLERAGRVMSSSLGNYMTMRASGVRGTRGLFTLDSSLVASAKQALVPLSPALYDIFTVRKDSPIKEFVETRTGAPYRLGSAYYEPTQAVVIQDHKGLLVQNRRDGKVYADRDLRQILGLPAQTVKVNPGQHSDWRIFVQSTSVNRKLFKDQFVVVMK